MSDEMEKEKKQAKAAEAEVKTAKRHAEKAKAAATTAAKAQTAAEREAARARKTAERKEKEAHHAKESQTAADKKAGEAQAAFAKVPAGTPEAKAATQAQKAAEREAAKARKTAERKAKEAEAAAKAQDAAEKAETKAKADAELKKTEAEKAEAAHHKAAETVAGMRRYGQPAELCFYFVDGDTGQPLHPKAPELEFKLEEGKWTQPLQLKEAKERYYLERSRVPAFLKGDKAVEVRMAASYREVNCLRHVSPPVSFLLNQDEAQCCCVPIPLYRLEEGCTITVRAFDCSLADYIKTNEALLDEVEVVVTAHPIPGAEQASTPTERARTLTARTADGIARISEVPLHCLFRIETRAPRGYISDTPSLLYRYICCERSLEIDARFRPCGKNPTRSIVFVRQECAGIRWKNGCVEVGGKPLETDEQGVVHIPNELSGVVEIGYPGFGFTPTSLNLSDPGTVVHTVAVADHVSATRGGGIAKRRFRFEDEHEQPFRRRPLYLVTKSGEKIATVTDDNGYFEAEEGSWAYAEEHELSPGTVPLLLSSKE